MTTLDLTDEETAALARLLLHNAIDGDRYPLSSRVQLLRGILAKIRSEPAREPFAAAQGVRAAAGGCGATAAAQASLVAESA